MLKYYTLRKLTTYICTNTRTNFNSCRSYNTNKLHQFILHQQEQIRSNQTVSTKCWKCGINRQDLKGLFCESCHTIQAPHEKKDYFELLRLEHDFDLNVKDLIQLYRRMQRVLHPDKFSNCSEEEKQISAEYSSLVNEAFNTLQAPLSRALHMLELMNEQIGEDEKSDNTEFLMEVLELNEEIDEADTPEKLQKLESQNKETLQKILATISKHFKAGDLLNVKKAIVRMKYYDSVSNRINNLLRERGIVD